MIAFLTLDKTVRAAGGVYAEKECICGMYVLNIKIKVGPRTRASRRERLYERAVRIMKRSGVENVCFQPPFVNEQYFIKAGFGELTSKYLRSRKVAEILRFVSPNALTAAVFAECIMQRETETIKALAENFRHVLLFTGSCPPALLRDTGERLGASLIETPTDRMLEYIDVAVFFCEPLKETYLPENCTALPVGIQMPKNVACSKVVEEVEVSVPDYISLPDDCPRESFISELMRSGVCCANDVCITNVSLKLDKS